MKVALCLHGLFDSQFDSHSKGLDGYNHIKRHILDVADVDVFIHSWQVDRQAEIENLYHPVKSVFEKQIDFKTIALDRNLYQLRRTPRPPDVILSHLYSVTECIKLAYLHGNYDVVIKARFDLGRINRETSGPNLGNPYPVQCINFKTDIERDRLYTANWNHFHMGPADMWFYGDSNVMHEFTYLYSDLYQSFHIDSEFHKFATSIENNPGDLSNAIAFYKYWMIKNGLWEKLIKLETTWE